MRKTHCMVIPNSLRPKTQHSPEWNEDTEQVRSEEHRFGFNFKIVLEIPEAKRRRDGTAGLGNT